MSTIISRDLAFLFAEVMHASVSPRIGKNDAVLTIKVDPVTKQHVQFIAGKTALSIATYNGKPKASQANLDKIQIFTVEEFYKKFKLMAKSKRKTSKPKKERTYDVGYPEDRPML